MLIIFHSVLISFIQVCCSFETLPYNTVSKYFVHKDLDWIDYFYCQNENKSNSSLIDNIFKSYKSENNRSPMKAYVGYDEYLLLDTFVNVRGGIFLDMTCPKASLILKQSSLYRLFSLNYDWFIAADSMRTVYRELSDLKLSVNSQVTLMTLVEMSLSRNISNFNAYRFYDVYKYHYSKSLIVNEVDLFNSKEETGIKNNKLVRKDFGGIELNVSFAFIGVKQDASNNLEIWANQFYKPNSPPHTRSLITLFQHFRDFYNVKFHYKLTDNYGVETEVGNGNWSGMIGHLSRQETEFCIQESRMRDDRMLVADVIITTRVYRIFFSFLQPQSFGSYKALIKPLAWQLWLGLFAVVILLIIKFKVISLFDSSTEVNAWSAAALHTIGSITQQGAEVRGLLVSYHLATIVLLIFSFLATVYYSGAVLNGLLSPSKSSINTLQDLLDSNYQLGLWDIVFVKDFEGSYNPYGPQSQAHIQRLFEKIKHINPRSLYYSLDDGVEHLSQGRFAFFSDNANLYKKINSKLTPPQICSLTHISTISPFHLGIYTVKKSPYKEHLLILFQWMREVGLTSRAQNIWYEKATPCLGTFEAIAIGIKAISSGFFILVAGFLLSSLIFMLEIHFSKRSI